MKNYLFFFLLTMLCSALTAETNIDFNRDIRPILSDRCFHCHGPDEHDRKKKLRLDIAEGEDGAYRIRKEKAAIKPGNPELSTVWQRIITDDEDDVMPPSDSHKKPLTDEEKALIKQWISEGAKYDAFWAFQTPAKHPAPAVKSEVNNPIDNFVLKALEVKGKSPKNEADKRTLIRRVSFDLTGLPPTREEIQLFLQDSSANAYEKLVDRLLAKNQYGEHMTKYWLDLVRFADTNGIHHDHYREMTPYRDWVIRSFNQNLKYDDFVRYQIAGDLYEKPSKDQLVASGFNRLHLIIDVGTALPEESYTKNVIDRVTSVGTAFMGLTVQCAVCHDHKYDPITMKDFYGLFAFFNNIDATPETGGRRGFDFKNGLQPPYIFLEGQDNEEKLSQINKQINTMEAKRKKLSRTIANQSKEEKQKIQAEISKLQKAISALQPEVSKLEKDVKVAMVMKERKEIRPAYILIRGQYDKPGEKVERNTPAFLPPLKKKGGIPSRMDLAEWLVAKENPLTARVAVNRFWQQLFGVGLVKSSEDFGAQGQVPSHPKLLDYLTVKFIESGWDIKALMKHIVLSKTYKQSSLTSPAEFKEDPENRTLARGSRYRMDSEMIRDQILATSGLLVDTMFGKSVKPPQPDGLWKAVNMPGSYPRTYTADTGDKIYRRSVYTFWKRGMPPPQMSIFNAPTREDCTARRERTNTPLQALLMFNETEYMKAARNLAQKTLAKSNLSDPQKVSEIYETITSKIPDQKELAVLSGLIEELSSSYLKNPKLADDMCRGIQVEKNEDKAKLAAWTMLVSSIYNLDIVKTKE